LLLGCFRRLKPGPIGYPSIDSFWQRFVSQRRRKNLASPEGVPRMATAQTEHSRSSSNKRLRFVALIAFLPTGVLTTLLGPMLPLLIARWTLNDTQAGNLFLVQFLAQLVGVQLSGVLLARLGYRPAFLSGLLLMAGGAATLLTGSAAMGMASVAVYGLGLGLIIPTDSLLVAEITPDSRSSAMNLLNFFWGAGAVMCSLVVAWASAHGMVPVFLGSVSGILVLLALAAWGLPFPAAKSEAERPLRWQELARNPAIWLFAAVFFLYPGAETAVGGWIGSYVARLGTEEIKWAPLMPAFFWSALTAGRGLGTLFVSYLPERRVLRAGFATAAAGIVLLLVASTLPGVIVGALITGLSFATLYPITIARLSHHFGVAARSIGAFMFSLAAVGPAVISWLVGVTSQATGSLRAGLLLPLGATVILLLIHLREW
jgi:MFS transporter, FHS family, glucose/mannose:H+ symporter